MKTAIAWALCASVALGQGPSSEWLKWPVAFAESIGRKAYVRGRVGGFFDVRILKTERSYNYKLAATWVTPDVIRASVRVQQVRSRMSDAEALQAVAKAEGVGDTVVMVEIDPREGSGVIPDDWSAFLQPVFAGDRRGDPIRGQNMPGLRDVAGLSGVLRRNYDYDRFWVVFPLKRDDGSAVIPSDAVSAELVVRIHNQEGRVQWMVPSSLRVAG